MFVIYFTFFFFFFYIPVGVFSSFLHSHPIERRPASRRLSAHFLNSFFCAEKKNVETFLFFPRFDSFPIYGYNARVKSRRNRQRGSWICTYSLGSRRTYTTAILLQDHTTFDCVQTWPEYKSRSNGSGRLVERSDCISCRLLYRVRPSSSQPRWKSPRVILSNEETQNFSKEPDLFAEMGRTGRNVRLQRKIRMRNSESYWYSQIELRGNPTVD